MNETFKRIWPVLIVLCLGATLYPTSQFFKSVSVGNTTLVATTNGQNVSLVVADPLTVGTLTATAVTGNGNGVTNSKSNFATNSAAVTVDVTLYRTNQNGTVYRWRAEIVP